MKTIFHQWSGVLLDLADPRPEDICLCSIVHSLARVARFAGHTDHDRPYSVAQHSVLVASQLRVDLARWGLLHDAAEAYIGDIPRPARELLRPQIDEIEERLLRAISERFDLGWPIPAEVRVADDRLLAAEGRDLCSERATWAWWTVLGHEPYQFLIRPWSVPLAEARFAATAANLRIRCGGCYQRRCGVAHGQACS